ncbi:MAG: hypothetical protein US50_C0038G0005 [Candidatus Nomurabacteria bacterium GW2011_GWB1_37_5]|uniref:Uncharacterized protein n=1 Tax=Candidatus Nomurabacteria bacterium GW2011_GWB1_37_5 TaxID=1618742 RepID=A0A0G0H8A2_9BACT|nr:MAG: hypothetical protein US50_C0038G0005 [Candidatus Nomurabacteria bacterium GW2011_GWB1_37_5]
MKKFFTFGFIAFLLAVSFVTPIKIHAQVGDGMAIYQKFIMGQMKCADLNDADFFAVGDYVLKQVPEAQRSVLNVYIDQYKGTMNDKDFSTLMGKYFTACAVPGTAGTGLLNTSSGDTGKTKLPYGYGGYGWGMMSGFGIFFYRYNYIDCCDKDCHALGTRQKRHGRHDGNDERISNRYSKRAIC